MKKYGTHHKDLMLMYWASFRASCNNAWFTASEFLKQTFSKDLAILYTQTNKFAYEYR